MEVTPERSEGGIGLAEEGGFLRREGGIGPPFLVGVAGFAADFLAIDEDLDAPCFDHGWVGWAGGGGFGDLLKLGRGDVGDRVDFLFDGDVDVDDFACEDPAFLGGGACEVGVVFEGDLVVGFAGLILFGFGEFRGGFDLDFDPVFGGPAFVFDVGGLDLGSFLDIDVDLADIDEFFLACSGWGCGFSGGACGGGLGGGWGWGEGCEGENRGRNESEDSFHKIGRE